MSRKKQLLIVMSSIFLFAGTAPQKGDTVELQAWLNARSTGYFRPSDNNVQRVLAPGTKGRIAEESHIKRFTSGNYGICLTIEGSDSPCSWVYYKVRRPNMKLYSRDHKQTSQPESAVAATVLVPTPIVNAIATASRGFAPATSAADSAQAKSDSTAIATQAIQNATRLNTTQSSIGSAPATVCTDCEMKKRAEPNQCSILNSYIEKELKREKDRGSLLGQLMSGASVRPTIKLACVRTALALEDKGAKYRHCEPGDKTASINRGKACQSENYTQVIYQGLNLVSECFKGLDSKTPLQHDIRTEMNTFLMMWESGLQMNAYSSRGAGGLGQLTPGAIADTNRIYFNEIKDHFAKTSNPLCQRLANETLATKMSASTDAFCERMAVSHGSPLKNLVYTFGYQMLLRDHLERTVWSNLQIQRYLSDLSERDREGLKTTVAAWSHNSGPGGMQQPLLAFVNDRARSGKKLKDSEIRQFMTDLEAAMKNNPHKDNSSNARRTETSSFMGKIMGRAATVSNSAGGTCLE